MSQSETVTNSHQVDPIASARAKKAVRLNSSGSNNTTGTRVGGMFATKAGTNRRITTAGATQQQFESGQTRAGQEDAGDTAGERHQAAQG